MTHIPFARSALRFLSVVVCSTLGLAACDLSTDPPNLDADYGIVTLSAVQTGASTFRAKAVGEFFNGTVLGLPNSTAPYDSCRIQSITADTTGTAPVTDLDAGTPVTVALAGVTTNLTRVAKGSRFNYVPSGNGTIAYTPGDSVVVSVPGSTAGFPGVQLSGKTAEAFTMDAVPVFQNADTPLKWSAATLDRSALLVQLRYAAGSTEFNQELRCFLIDDGSFTIPAAVATRWGTSSNAKRDVIATRLRTAFVTSTTGDALFEIVSTFQIPTPTTP
jgi:hypothetical protein